MMTPVLLIGMIAGTDLCIKEEIEARDSSEFPKELKGSKGMITLHKSHNTGFPFEVLKSRPELVRTLPLAVMSGLAGILIFLMPKKGHLMEKAMLVFTLGGALSNLYDRFTRKYVVDYFSINVGCLKKVIFNLGDIFIFIGAILAVASQMGYEISAAVKRKKRKTKVK